MSKGCVVKVCDCRVSMSNTGEDCQSPMEAARKLIFVPTYDSTGALNFLDLTTPINLATFTALINETDSSKRYFPLPSLSDVNDTRNEPVTQTTAEDEVLFVREGIRTLEGTIWGKKGNNILAGKINTARCNDMSTYIVDRNGSLIGTPSSDGTKFYPKRMDTESVYAQYIPSGPKTKPGIKLRFNFHIDESDACMKMIPRSEMDNVNLFTLKGLLNAHPTYSLLATTGFTVKLTTEYGTALTDTEVQGMLAADFVSSVTAATSKVRRTNNTPADVAITVTESVSDPGTYAVVFGVAQTTGDIIQVLLKHNGYDFTDLLNSQVTIP